MNGSEPAFPVIDHAKGPDAIGLTKREYFAAMAMQGIWANEKFEGNIGAMAKDSVRAADAIILALSKGETNGS